MATIAGVCSATGGILAGALITTGIVWLMRCRKRRSRVNQQTDAEEQEETCDAEISEGEPSRQANLIQMDVVENFSHIICVTNESFRYPPPPTQEELRLPAIQDE